MEEELELVHMNVESYTSDQSDGEPFLKGAAITWDDLSNRVDADRAITSNLEQDVRLGTQ